MPADDRNLIEELELELSKLCRDLVWKQVEVEDLEKYNIGKIGVFHIYKKLSS